MPISQGSVVNFNALAYSKLDWFKEWAKNRLIKSGLLNADETGVNIDGTLHCLSRDKKRGTKAMNNMGVLANFRGILVHDHWKAYFKYGCDHSLCNAHHLRELARAYGQDGKIWAKKLAT